MRKTLCSPWIAIRESFVPAWLIPNYARISAAWLPDRPDADGPGATLIVNAVDR